jgi:hypothetical protein
MSLFTTNFIALLVLYLNGFKYYYAENNNFIPMIIQSVLLVITDYTFFKTAFREPGVIPAQIDSDIRKKDFQKYSSDPINYKNGSF